MPGRLYVADETRHRPAAGLLPRRRLGGGRARQRGHRVPLPGDARRGVGAVGRLPAGARAPVPGGPRRRAGGVPVRGRPGRVEWGHDPDADRRSPATARAATWPPSSARTCAPPTRPARPSSCSSSRSPTWPREHPSYDDFGEGFFLTRKQMTWYRTHYLGDQPADHPRVSPLLAADLSGLPPAYVAVSGFDVLRDEGEAYAAAAGRGRRPGRAAPPRRPGARVRQRDRRRAHRARGDARGVRGARLGLAPVWAAPGAEPDPTPGILRAMSQYPAPPPPGGYPPSAPNHPQAITILVLGILSLVACQVLGPFAWVMGNRRWSARSTRPAGPWEAATGQRRPDLRHRRHRPAGAQPGLPRRLAFVFGAALVLGQYDDLGREPRSPPDPPDRTSGSPTRAAGSARCLTYSRRGSRLTPRQQAAWEAHHADWVIPDEAVDDAGLRPRRLLRPPRPR